MAKLKVNSREIAPAMPAVVEKTYTLTLTEGEAKGVLAVSGKMAIQEDHPNSLSGVYSALFNEFGYCAGARVVTLQNGNRVHAAIKFAD